MVFCSNCGAADQNGKFCSQCGSKVGSPATQSAASVQAAPSNFTVAPTERAPAAEPKKSAYANIGLTSSRFRAPPADKCPRCDKRVYAAEAVDALGKKFHKTCFKCTSCKRRLEKSHVCENDGNLYCKTCYGQNFGPKGYGFGQGAGALTSTT
ncbi:MAG: hypothetical protein MHM6MM_003711 [Cercozoa sp. M6MM]